MDNSNLIEILDCISPSDCNYQEWVNVGMALKYEGFTIDDCVVSQCQWISLHLNLSGVPIKKLYCNRY